MLNTNSAELSTMEREWSCGGGGGDGGGVCDRNTCEEALDWMFSCQATEVTAADT